MAVVLDGPSGVVVSSREDRLRGEHDGFALGRVLGMGCWQNILSSQTEM